MTKEWKGALLRAAEIVDEEYEKTKKEAAAADSVEELAIKTSCMIKLAEAAARIRKERG